jgi:UPF0716 family protein affecting phage T7 exclusion
MGQNLAAARATAIAIAIGATVLLIPCFFITIVSLKLLRSFALRGKTFTRG